MATAFIARHCSALALALAALGAAAADVSYVGAIGDKAAILVIDGSAPRTVKVGQKLGAVTVLEVERERAIVDVAGERRVLQRGQHYQLSTDGGDRQSTVLAADSRGHFIADGAINGGPVRFVVDTGATVVALPAQMPMWAPTCTHLIYQLIRLRTSGPHPWQGGGHFGSDWYLYRCTITGTDNSNLVRKPVGNSPLA